MKHLCVLLLVVAGCFPTKSQDYACQTDQQCAPDRTCDNGYCVVRGSGVDARPEVDAPPSSATCEATWPGATVLFDPCDIGDPESAPPSFAAPGIYKLDTTVATSNLTAPGGAVSTIKNVMNANGRVLTVASFDIPAGSTVEVVGSLPLVVASWSTISIAGTLDGSSYTGTVGATHTADQAGPGAVPQPATCTPGTAAQTGGSDGDGGGAGGTYQTLGGNGGRGGADPNVTGGAVGTLRVLPLLAAGCSGQAGAASGGGAAGPGGAGGGAIALTAKTSITIAGTVTVGGAGGKGAATGNDSNNGSRPGGGGGGSGGMIGLESAAITVTGTLAANGGGGGQGWDNVIPGGHGMTGPATATAATGGRAPRQGGEDSGGYGGTGGFGGTGAAVGGKGNETTPGQSTGTQGGGGGGGGATGFIAWKDGAPSAGGTITPAFTPRP